jgi:hypothetical protein
MFFSYGCKTCNFTLKETNKLEEFENEVLMAEEEKEDGVNYIK